MKRYKVDSGSKPARRKILFASVFIILVIVVGVFLTVKYLLPTQEEKAVNQLQFDESLTEAEKQIITNAVTEQSITIDGSVNIAVDTVLESENGSSVITAYVPVTNVYASKQLVTKAELADMTIYIPENMDPIEVASIAQTLGLEEGDLVKLSDSPEAIKDTEIAFIPVDQLNPNLKLLTFEGEYYLDSFDSGAIFRQAIFTGDASEELAELSLNDLTAEEETLKVNMSGVTALTRLMMRKLNTVQDPLYFSEKIGDFMADADITHVSNEVSFRENCQYSNTSFCSPPEFIETLKASGVNLVELTGNHNNDGGSIYNTETINLYQSLDIATFGGGINAEEAAKPHITDQKGSNIAFFGYNMADGQGSGAIATSEAAGANFYTDEKARLDIETAKQNSQFIIVNIQYAECQAYPAGYVEYPICDSTIGGQEEAFKKLIDFGADMVVGSSAHQPQTYEIYKGKPIYYGLGNMYFDQYQWPGTERGIILSHYFVDGKLVQTKLSPTVFDIDLQTRLMTNEEAVYLLDRLNSARN